MIDLLPKAGGLMLDALDAPDHKGLEIQRLYTVMQNLCGLQKLVFKYP